MTQLSLLHDDTKSKTIVRVPVGKLTISPFNPRQTRNDASIQKLAERIERNGFEITRALWAYANNGHYEVFAGGNRLEAVKRTLIDEVPVVLHDGYSEDEITRLADEDNENDEYHDSVPIVDVWMDYKRLADMGWTPKRIAEAKQVTLSTVSARMKYSGWPRSVIAVFFKNDTLKESHAAEIYKISNFENLSPWLTWEQAALEVIDAAVKKGGTAKHFRAIVDTYNDVIDYVQKTVDGWGEVIFHTEEGKPYQWDARMHFLAGCANNNARTLSSVKRAEHHTRERISEEKKRYAALVAKEAADAAEAEESARPIEVLDGQWWRLGEHLLYCGDTSAREFSDKALGNFAFADPPYNAGAADWDSDFQWSHDWLIDNCPVVAVTPGIASIVDFSRTTSMPYVWSMAAWITNGMTRGAMGFGNWIYVSLFSRGSVHNNAQDFVKVSIATSQTNETDHKGRKPIDLVLYMIETFTQKQETVIDPFLGSGTTLFACESSARKCIGGEINPQYCKDIIERWQAMTGQAAELV